MAHRIPFGYRLTPDERQQAAIRRMIELRRARKSYRTIEAAMKAEGVRLSHTAIKRVLDELKVE